MDNFKFGSFVVIFLLVIALGIVCVIKIGKGCYNGIKELDKNQTELKSKVGTRIVVDKDTLTILDYSTFNQNFTLSNGTKVSKEFVDKHSN